LTNPEVPFKHGLRLALAGPELCCIDPSANTAWLRELSPLDRTMLERHVEHALWECGRRGRERGPGSCWRPVRVSVLRLP